MAETGLGRGLGTCSLRGCHPLVERWSQGRQKVACQGRTREHGLQCFVQKRVGLSFRNSRERVSLGWNQNEWMQCCVRGLLWKCDGTQILASDCIFRLLRTWLGFADCIPSPFLGRKYFQGVFRAIQVKACWATEDQLKGLLDDAEGPKVANLIRNWWSVSNVSVTCDYLCDLCAIFKCRALLRLLQSALAVAAWDYQHEMTVALWMWTVRTCWNYAMQVVEMSPKTDQEDEEERTKELGEFIWLCSFSPFNLEICQRQDLLAPWHETIQYPYIYIYIFNFNMLVYLWYQYLYVYMYKYKKSVYIYIYHPYINKNIHIYIYSDGQSLRTYFGKISKEYGGWVSTLRTSKMIPNWYLITPCPAEASHLEHLRTSKMHNHI